MSKLPFLMVAILVAALSPAASSQQPAKPAEPAIDAVPTDAFMFVSVKVSKLWDHPAAKPLREWMAMQTLGPLDRVIGLRPDEIDRVTLFCATANRDDGGAPVLIVTTRKPVDPTKMLKPLQERQLERRHKERMSGTIFEIDGEFRWLQFVDDRTLLYLPRDLDDKSLGPTLVAQLLFRKPDGLHAAALAAAAQHDLTVSVDVARFAEHLRSGRLGDPDPEYAPYLSLLGAKRATLTADFGATAKGQLVLTFADAAAAKRNLPVLSEALPFFAEEFGNSPDPIENFALRWFAGVLKAATVSIEGANVVATVDVPFLDDLAGLVALLPKDLSVARNEARAKNNLKQLGLALHNMHDTYGVIPGDLGFGSKPLPWSWRVQALPFIEQDNLYRQLNMEKPWDDPENLKKLESFPMPAVFEIPGRPAVKGHTYFRVFTLPKSAKGTDQPFFKEGLRGPKFEDVRDGLSNTFMVVEAGEAVPWYKPDVLAYDGKLPLPQLGAKDADKFLALFGDGSVKVLRPSKLDEKTIRALITINGGEPVEQPK